MEIDFNEQCEVPDDRLRFYATYETEETPAEPDVNWPAATNITYAEYTVELVKRRRGFSKLVTTDEKVALILLNYFATELGEFHSELESFAELTTSRIDAIEQEALADL